MSEQERAVAVNDRVTYALADGIATITMDDGKVNALSQQMFDGLNDAFDRAESDRAVVVLTGRDGRFSAGFDLGVLGGGGSDATTLLRSGFKLAERMLSFPRPVVIACNGHTIAMGVFLLLSGDYRIGADGPFKIVANEVALGMAMPRTAVEICRQRLAPAHFHRAVILAETYSPDSALSAGFLDRSVSADELQDVARSTAAQFAATLNMDAHATTKLRARDLTLAAVREAMQADEPDFQALARMSDARAGT